VCRPSSGASLAASELQAARDAVRVAGDHSQAEAAAVIMEISREGRSESLSHGAADARTVIDGKGARLNLMTDSG